VPPIIYVMGPSGAGKDSVLRFARAALRPADRVAFAHRYITRPQDESEDFISLTDTEFALRREAGLFAFHWQARGTNYGIGIEIEAWRKAGFTVVVSGSRAHYTTLDQTAGIIPVLITAPPDVLARRLGQRGREDAADIGQRLNRATEFAVDDPRLVTIDNSGPLEEAGSRLLSLLRAPALAPA
jgi:ribose 1,5-bisphosphokinase